MTAPKVDDGPLELPLIIVHAELMSEAEEYREVPAKFLSSHSDPLFVIVAPVITFVYCAEATCSNVPFATNVPAPETATELVDLAATLLPSIEKARALAVPKTDRLFPAGSLVLRPTPPRALTRN